MHKSGDEYDDNDRNENHNIFHFDIRHLRLGNDGGFVVGDGVQTETPILDRRPSLHRPGRGCRRPFNSILPSFQHLSVYNISLIYKLNWFQFIHLRMYLIYRVEPTASPGIAFKNEDDDGSSYPSFPTPGESTPLQGSLLTPFGYGDDVTETRAPEPVGFAVIANAINNALIALGLADPTTFVTDTTTTFKTTTMKTTTSTKTIFLSGCSPSPFPFSTCAAKG